MRSFNQELKTEIVAEIIRHREQDQIIQGTYGEGTGDNWKGCAVGCAIRSLNLRKGKDFSVSSHSVYETEFGIPRILARLEDRIFEGLSVEDSKTWPENFMSAVPVDSDLSLVWPKFAVWLLTDKEDGVIKFAKTDNQREVIQKVSDLYSQSINGVLVSKEDWGLAHKNAAAYAAAAAAADAAAAYAAAAAAAAAADAAARRAHFKKMADKLIEILTNGRSNENIQYS